MRSGAPRPPAPDETLKKLLLSSAGLRAGGTLLSNVRRWRAPGRRWKSRARELGLPAEGGVFDDRLVEFTFGRWEGLTWPEVCAAAIPNWPAARERRQMEFHPAGGESYAQLAGSGSRPGWRNRSVRAWWSRMAASPAP